MFKIILRLVNENISTKRKCQACRIIFFLIHKQTKMILLKTVNFLFFSLNFSKFKKTKFRKIV